MKIKLFIIGLAISLMSTKCAEKAVYISFENKSERNVIFSCTKNSEILNTKLKRGDFFHGNFEILHKNILKKDSFPASGLNFYLSKDKIFYTFYFLRVIKYDSKKNDYVFDKKYDSINISKDKIKIGEGARNSFLYGTDKIVFKSKELD